MKEEEGRGKRTEEGERERWERRGGKGI